jgi:hypothetical protein
MSGAAHKRVLFIAYQFPPVGGAGVQRAVKFVKYLPQFAWLPTVLTVANPSVPLFDNSFATDLSGPVTIRRAPTWEPSYSLKSLVSGGSERPTPGAGSARRLVRCMARQLTGMVLQPDPQILWVPGAIRHGLRALRETAHDAILVTAPPFSAFLAGASLSRRTGLPLVLDYRDEWDLTGAYWENRRVGLVSRRVQGYLQQRVVRAADALLATTRRSAESLEAIRAAAGGLARVTWIYNGFDAADFPARAEVPQPPGSPYRLAYVGTLWNLTSVAPLVEAVRRLCGQSPDLAAHLELVFAGRRTGEQQAILNSLRGLPCRLVEHPYLDHHGSVELLHAADTLCVLLSDVPGAGRVVPAKVFEYMATKRPILAIGPPGEMGELLADYPQAHLCRPDNIEGICAYLAEAIRRRPEGTVPPSTGWDVSRYGRRAQAQQLAQLLNSLLRPE